MKLAFVFPGQGSQAQGMLLDLMQQFAVAKQTFIEASDTLHCDLLDMVQNGGDKLEQTEFVQPLLLTADIAVWRTWLQENGKKPSFLAGHSLGEYAALVAANALDFKEAVRLVHERGRLMQQAVPQGKGAMLAIVGLDDDKVSVICREAAGSQVLEIANYNSIGQVVLAGETAACERALNLALQQGAKLAKLLAVSVPSHCLLMKPAAISFLEYLQKIKINVPEIPVIHNADVCFYDDVNKIRDALVRQLYCAVRWVETILFMEKHGVQFIFECGPGKVLTGLNKRISQNLTVDFLGLSQKIVANLDVDKSRG